MYTVREGGQWSTCIHLSKSHLYVHCDFEKGSQNQHFQSTLLVGKES